MKKALKSVVAASVVFVFVLSFAVSSVMATTPKTYKITMATTSNPSDNCVKAFFYFKDLVEKNSANRITVDVKHTGQLGGHRDYMEGMKMGSIQAAEVIKVRNDK